MPIFPSRPGPNKFRLVPVEPVIIPVPESIRYGLLYNWYAATDVRGVTASGWHLPSEAEFVILWKYLDGTANNFYSAVAGGRLKETGYTHWDSPNTGAVNDVGFNSRGGGNRSPVTNFTQLNIYAYYLRSDSGLLAIYNRHNESSMGRIVVTANHGASIRPVKDSTILSHGEIGSYTDPSGYIYPTICVGTQEWVSCNIKTQHYRNGDSIPEVTDNVAWVALTSGALCAYDNDWANV